MTVNEKFSCDYSAVEKPVKDYGFGMRHLQVFLVFICVSVAYIMRVDMNVAMIAMTDKNSSHHGIEVFDWPKKTQGIILSSFFWGYTIMQIPAGQLANRYGPKPLFAMAMIVNGVLTLMTPWMVHLGGWQAACALRVLQGLSQAAFFPGIQTLVSKWIPNHERSRLSNFMVIGTPFGTVVGMPLSSILASTSYGWPFTFYVIGTVGLITGLIWIYYGANSPASHKSITEEEKFYIESSLGHTEEREPLKTPWKSFATSLPVFALIVGHVGCNWGFLTLLVETPGYLKHVLGIDMKQSGLLSALPYAAMWIGGFAMSFLSDFIVNKKIFSVTVTRKIFNSVGTWLPAIGVIVLSFVPAGSPMLAVGIITVTVGLSSGMHMGYMMNHIDLTPNFAGSLMGITNCLANAVGGLAPLTVGFIVSDNTNPKQWQTVFFTTAAVYFLSNLFYIIFSTSKRQQWNEPNNVFGDEEMAVVIKEKKPQIVEKQAMLSKNIKK